jgi:hypothetical protein
MPQFDNFTTPMSAGDALSKLNGAFDSVVGHNHLNTGNGAKIPTAALSGQIATSVLSGSIATSVLSGNIAGANISGSVASAANADKIDGLHIKIIDIGNWDMNSNPFITASHGLTQSKIRTINVTIISDDGDMYNGLTGLSQVYATSTGSIIIGRDGSGIFANSNFNDSISTNGINFNRGYVMIGYID